jgi:hypothetical protein
MSCAMDDPRLRRAACCEAEPMCALCPLRPENARLALAELKAQGLRGRLPELGL